MKRVATLNFHLFIITPEKWHLFLYSVQHQAEKVLVVFHKLELCL